jgi:hypothetical protein
MNLIEALQLAKDKDMWFRPVSWKGSGCALTVEAHEPQLPIFFVPTSKGGFRALMPNFEDLVGEWNVVSPDNVNAE